MKSPVPPTDEATNNREAIKVPDDLASQWQSQEGLDTRDHDTQLRAPLLLSLNSLQFSKIPPHPIPSHSLHEYFLSTCHGQVLSWVLEYTKHLRLGHTESDFAPTELRV